MSALEEMFALQCEQAGLPAPLREYAAVPGRRYRWDFAWADARVQVETYGKWARVFCPLCGASTMSLPCGSFDPTPAAVLWNKRVEVKCG